MIIMRPRAADYIAPPGFCPLHDTLRNEPPKMSEPVLYLLSVATVDVYVSVGLPMQAFIHDLAVLRTSQSLNCH